MFREVSLWLIIKPYLLVKLLPNGLRFTLIRHSNASKKRKAEDRLYFSQRQWHFYLFIFFFCWRCDTFWIGLLQLWLNQIKWWSYEGQKSPVRLFENNAGVLEVICVIPLCWQEAWQGLLSAPLMPVGPLILYWSYWSALRLNKDGFHPGYKILIINN